MANGKVRSVTLSKDDLGPQQWGGETWSRMLTVEVTHQGTGKRGYYLWVSLHLERSNGDGTRSMLLGWGGSQRHLLLGAERFSQKVLEQQAAAAVSHPLLDAMKAEVTLAMEAQGVR